MSVFASRTAQPAQLAAFVCTDQGAELAQAVAQMLGADRTALHGGGLGGAARVSTDIPSAKTLLTEMGNMSLDAACECVAELSSTGAVVVVVGVKPDLVTYRALRNAGAAEYFAFPVTPEEIIAAQNQTASNSASKALPSVPPVGRCIAVTGTNGGVGSSLLAQSLAFHAASATGPAQQTALIDADLRFGSQAIDLDRKGTPGLLEALSAPDRVDQTFLGATMEQLNERLSLYSQQAHATQSIHALEAAFPRLLHTMRTSFDTMIVDLPRTTLFDQPDFANVLDTLILVIPAGYSGVYVASHMMAHLKAEAPELTIIPVLSEYREDAKLSRKDIAKAIGMDIRATLPRSDTAIRKAHRGAKPLIESQPRSDHAKATRLLWELLTKPASPAHSKPKKQGLFRRAAA